MSSLAVDEQEYFTFDVTLLDIDPDMLSLMQAHDASASAPSGHKSHVCYTDPEYQYPDACDSIDESVPPLMQEELT
jgi:hypothetical protein